MNCALHWVLMFFCGLTLCAELRADGTAKQLATYRYWHEACLTGGTDVIDAKIAMFEARLAVDPNDYLAQAFLGSACALRAKSGFWGPTKLKFLKRGKTLMEGAVAAAPQDIRVRMVRAIAYYRIPKRFKVRPVAIADFKFLVPFAKAGKGGLELEERQVILYYASQAYAEEGIAEAAALKKLCHELDPKSEYGKKAG